jgi:Flp pilus assembly protein TadD
MGTYVRTFAYILMICVGVSACEEPTPETSIYAPKVDLTQEAVDGLIVGHRLMDAGELELAHRAYLRAASVHGLNAETYSALGSVNLRMGRLGQAEDMLRRAVDEDPDFAEAWNNLGAVLMEREQFAEAARVFRLAFALDRGESDSIRENLRLALAKIENPTYTGENDTNYELVRTDTSEFVIEQFP